MQKPHPFFGAICPAVTPFNTKGKVDFLAMEKHYKMLTDAKINGILVMGTIGEFVNMSIKERLIIIKEVQKMTDLPLIINVSSTVIDDMLKLADASYYLNNTTVMVLPHYYYSQTYRQLYDYFKYLGDRFKSDWFIYNFPARTGCDVGEKLVSRLIVDYPKFIGIKDTVDCMSHNRSLILTTKKIRKNFAVFSGFDEYFIPNLMNGGAGVLSGLINIIPEVFVSIFQVFKNNDFVELIRLQKEISKLSNIYNIGDDFVTTIKNAVAYKFGYIEPNSRNFAGELNLEQTQEVKKLLNLS